MYINTENNFFLYYTAELIHLILKIKKAKNLSCMVCYLENKLTNSSNWLHYLSVYNQLKINKLDQ